MTWVGQHQVELGQGADVAVLGEPDRQSVARSGLEVEAHRLAQRENLLKSEAEREPRVDQLALAGRNQGVVAVDAALHELAGDHRVGSANRFGLAGAANVLRPRVRSPLLGRPWRHQHVAGGLARGVCDRARCLVPGIDARQRAAGSLGRLITRIERRQPYPRVAVTLGEQFGRIVDQARGESAHVISHSHGATLRSRNVARVRSGPRNDQE